MQFVLVQLYEGYWGHRDLVRRLWLIRAAGHSRRAGSSRRARQVLGRRLAEGATQLSVGDRLWISGLEVEMGRIAAGYPDDMDRFIGSNPGLSSRFTRTLVFEDYSALELVAIVEYQARQHQYEVTAAAREELTRLFEQMPRADGFGNGRSARQIFQQMTERQAQRLAELTAPSPAQLVSLEVADLPAAITTGS